MPGLRACYIPQQNLFPARKNEIVGGAPEAAPTNNSGTSLHIPVVSYALTRAVVLFPALAGSVGKYTDKDLQKTAQMAI